MDSQANFAISTVATAPAPVLTGPTLTLASGTATRFPAAPFQATIWPYGAYPDPTNAEIVRVTGIAGDVLTITRAQEGSVSRSIAPGDVVAATLTKQTINQYSPAELPSAVPANTILAKQYDPGRSAYNVTSDTFRNLHSAVATVKTGGVAKINIVGHSVVVGSVTVPRWTYSFATKIRNALNSRYSAGGTGVVQLVGTALTDDTRVVFTGSWALSAGTRGAFNAGCYNATGTGNVITFTPDIPVDSFTVYYVKNAASGTFNVAVDGGAANPVNANHGAPESTGSFTISAGALGNHSVSITAPASGQAYIVGIEGTYGTTGFRVTRCGRAGAEVGTIVATGGVVGSDTLACAIDMVGAQLTIIMCQINDYVDGISLATYIANLTTLVNRAKLTGDVLVIADENILLLQNVTTGLAQSAYHGALYALADSLGFGVVDIASRWKDYATSVATPIGFMANIAQDSTGEHPYVIGHQDIANAVLTVLYAHGV